jgi:hypothetical protein
MGRHDGTLDFRPHLAKLRSAVQRSRELFDLYFEAIEVPLFRGPRDFSVDAKL